MRQVKTLICFLGVLGCGADDTIDPGALELRDLLGVDPGVAARWTPRERAAARGVLSSALAATPRVEWEAPLLAADDVATQMALAIDESSLAVALASIAVETGNAHVRPLRAPDALAASKTAPPVDFLDGNLPARGAPVLWALARAAGHPEAARLAVLSAPRAPFGAAYLSERRLLLANPVVLYALEPDGPDAGGASRATLGGLVAVPLGAPRGGNPYNFYGSVGECAAAERTRCESCLPAHNCKPEAPDTTDGNLECTTLAANDGRGYYERCANLALAIATVAQCVDDATRGACAYSSAAGSSLGSLAANDRFLDDAACATALDRCLSELYGPPSHPFPPAPTDGGTPPPPSGGTRSFDCGSCNSDTSCNFSPQCNPPCNNSNCSSGCSSNCTNNKGSSCDSSCSKSGSGGSSGSSNCSSSGGSSGSNSCGSSSSSGSSGCKSGNCTVGVAPPSDAPAAFGWGVMPLVVLLVWRRRARRGGGR